MLEKRIIDAEDIKSAALICAEEYGWYPSEVREVDSGNNFSKSFLCFESQEAAETWDNQK